VDSDNSGWSIPPPPPPPKASSSPAPPPNYGGQAPPPAMTFLDQPPPPAPPSGNTVLPDVGVTDTRISFDEARDGHADRVRQINEAVSEDGNLAVRALPMCSTATTPGPMAEFLLDIHLDPFGDWNMLYLGVDDSAAAALGTLPFSESFAARFDDVIIGAVMAAFGRWETAVEAIDPKALASTRAQLGSDLIDLTLGLQQRELGDSQRRIQQLTRMER